LDFEGSYEFIFHGVYLNFKQLILRWLKIGAMLLAGALILFLFDRSGKLLFRIIGLLGTVLFGFSVIVMLLTFRKAKRLSPWMLALTAFISMFCTLLFFTLTASPLSKLVATIAACIGFAAGIGWSLRNLLFVDREIIQIRGTLWSLLIWAVSIAIPQLFGILGYRTPYTAALFSFFGMGLTVGNSLGLIKRYVNARGFISRRMEVRP